MKKIKLFGAYCVFFTYTSCLASTGSYYAMTNCVSSASRLGDQLITYYKAKWLSYKYNIEFFLTDFPYSDRFALSKIDKNMHEFNMKKFKQHTKIKNENDLISYLNKKKNNKKNVLFNVCLDAQINESQTFEFAFDLHARFVGDKKFETEIKMLFQPLVVPQMNLPEGIITVAVHVRKGSGGDKPLISEQYFDVPAVLLTYEFIDLENKNNQSLAKQSFATIDTKQWWLKPSDYLHPTKFPPEQYYIDQINKLSALLLGAPLYVYIFTDDPNPQELVERFRRVINKQNIVFATRDEKNLYKDRVVEDLLLMSQFDCLIRGSSGFSLASQYIGSYKIIFFPRNFKWITEKNLMIDKVGIFLNKPKPNDPKAKLFDDLFASMA
jgi:hypothetical protein